MGERGPCVHPADLGEDFEDRIEAMKSPVLVALINRLGGTLTMPIDEINGTDAFTLVIGANAEARTFTFRVVRKED